MSCRSSFRIPRWPQVGPRWDTEFLQCFLSCIPSKASLESYVCLLLSQHFLPKAKVQASHQTCRIIWADSGPHMVIKSGTTVSLGSLLTPGIWPTDQSDPGFSEIDGLLIIQCIIWKKMLFKQETDVCLSDCPSSVHLSCWCVSAQRQL